MSAEEYRGAFYVYAPPVSAAQMFEPVLGFRAEDLQPGGRYERLMRFPPGESQAVAAGEVERAISFFGKALATSNRLGEQMIAAGRPKSEADRVLQKQAEDLIAAAPVGISPRRSPSPEGPVAVPIPRSIRCPLPLPRGGRLPGLRHLPRPPPPRRPAQTSRLAGFLAVGRRVLLVPRAGHALHPALLRAVGPSRRGVRRGGGPGPRQAGRVAIHPAVPLELR